VNTYPFIEAEKVEHRNVANACELLEVSRSAFYDWHQHRPSRRAVDDDALGLLRAHRISRSAINESRG